MLRFCRLFVVLTLTLILTMNSAQRHRHLPLPLLPTLPLPFYLCLNRHQHRHCFLPLVRLRTCWPKVELFAQFYHRQVAAREHHNPYSGSRSAQKTSYEGIENENNCYFFHSFFPPSNQLVCLPFFFSCFLVVELRPLELVAPAC